MRLQFNASNDGLMAPSSSVVWAAERYSWWAWIGSLSIRLIPLFPGPEPLQLQLLPCVHIQHIRHESRPDSQFPCQLITGQHSILAISERLFENTLRFTLQFSVILIILLFNYYYYCCICCCVCWWCTITLELDLVLDILKFVCFVELVFLYLLFYFIFFRGFGLLT